MRYLILHILLISCLLLSNSHKGKCQEGFSEKSRIKTTAHSLSLDPLGDFYLNNDYQLEKYDPEGNLLYTYSNFLAGNIFFVDPSDPFKVLVYYRDFSQVEVLNNTLSISADPILLQSYGLELATLTCRSYNNGIWVYDQQNFELVRLDPRLQKAESSGNISKILGQGINPDFLTEKDNMVYLKDPEAGILIFDKYGSYVKTMPINNSKTFQVIANKIYYYTDGQLVIYDTEKMSESYLKIDRNNVKDVKISVDLKPERLFILDEEYLYILIKNQ